MRRVLSIEDQVGWIGRSGSLSAAHDSRRVRRITKGSYSDYEKKKRGSGCQILLLALVSDVQVIAVEQVKCRGAGILRACIDRRKRAW